MLGLPHPLQCAIGVGVQRVEVARADGALDDLGQHAGVGQGEVQPFRAGGRHGVRGVAGEQQPAAAHRGLDEGAERQHGPLDHRALVELESVGPGQPRLQLAPDPVVGPGVRVLARVALEVHPLHGVGALADQREAPVRARVDQLGGRAGRLAQDPEPGERVLPEVAAPPLHVVAADRAGAVGAHDEVGAHLVRPPVAIDVRHPRPVGVEVVHGRVGDPVAQVAAVTGAGGVEVDEDVGLRVEPHRGADQLLEVDAVALAAEAQVDAAVPVAVGDHPLVAALVDARLGEQPHAVALEDAGAVGRADLLDRAVVDHDALDARAVQQVRQHQPRGAAADDRDLRAGHGHGSDAREVAVVASPPGCHSVE